MDAAASSLLRGFVGCGVRSRVGSSVLDSGSCAAGGGWGGVGSWSGGLGNISGFLGEGAETDGKAEGGDYWDCILHD